MYMGDWTTTRARAALDFSCPPKMRNIIEISKLRKNNQKWVCVGNYVIFCVKLHFIRPRNFKNIQPAGIKYYLSLNRRNSSHTPTKLYRTYALYAHVGENY